MNNIYVIWDNLEDLPCGVYTKHKTARAALKRKQKEWPFRYFLMTRAKAYSTGKLIGHIYRPVSSNLQAVIIPS